MRLHAHLARAAGVLASVAVLGLQLAAVEPASAVLARTATGRLVSYQPTRSKAARARSLAGARLAVPATATASASRTATATYKPCNGAGACLTYKGGPVMRATTLTAVFWNPEGLNLSYPTNYKSEIEQFLGDVAADSGEESNFFSVLPQYYETGSEVKHVTYSVTTNPAQTDTSALPTGAGEKCTSPTSPSRPCVSDMGVKNQLVSFVKAHPALGTGIGHEYIVFFPPGMESCFGETGEAGETCSGSFYCGYHGTLEAGAPKEIEYANEPDNADPAYGLNCLPEAGLKAGYATTGSTSHEISESVTDPEIGSVIEGQEKLSWYDENHLFIEPEFEPEYGEIGDMCAYEYQQGDSALEPYISKKVDSDGKPNQTIGGHEYLLQLEWDNAHSTCSLSAEAATTKATFTDTATPGMKTNESISFDGAGSHGPADKHISNTIATYKWNWGDGTATSTGSPTETHTYTSSQGEPAKTFTVTLTVTDKNGDEGSTTRTVAIENRPPTAAFASPAGATAGTPTQFEGSPSSDPDGTIAGYEWSFGDGTATTGPSPAHVYASPGEYMVKLTVTDDAGNTAEISHTVTVASPPARMSGTTGGETSKAGTSGVTSPSNVAHVTAVKRNKKKGAVALGVSVPGAGVLSAREASSAHASLVTPLAGALLAPLAYPVALVAAAKSKAKTKGPFVKSVSVGVSAARTLTIQIVPNAAGRALLRSKHKLALKILLAFTPTGGTQGTLVQPVTLVLRSTKKHK